MRCLIIAVMVLIFSCDRTWDNPLDTDEDLKNAPNIVQISLDSANNINITLDYTYSDSSTIILERKSIGRFEKINYSKETQYILVDNSFDRELSNTFTYRVCINKKEYRSRYSQEKQYIFASNGLNKPINLKDISIELKGIQLIWEDRSSNENSYIIEKDTGSGFSHLTTLSANSESCLDTISGMPQPPIQINYQVKAVNSNLESDWANVSVSYSGLGSPTDLKLTDSSASSLTIEWKDNSNMETGYSIERKKDESEFSEIATVDTNTTAYSDTITEIGHYFYRVRAMKDDLYSSYSNEIMYEFSNSPPPPPPDCIGFWPFNGNADDESENDNNGVVYGAVLTEDRFGVANSAYYFNGNAFIDLGNDQSLKPQLPVTISAWVRYENTNLIGSIFSTDFYPGRYYGVYLRTLKTREIGAWIGDGGGIGDASRRQKISTTQIELNTWYHIVAIISGRSDMKIYINGIEVEGGYSGSGSELAYSDTPGIIGKYNHGSITHFFVGLIDDIYFYNRSLTEGEIQQLYHDGGWDENE